VTKNGTKLQTHNVGNALQLKYRPTLNSISLYRLYR